MRCFIWFCPDSMVLAIVQYQKFLQLHRPVWSLLGALAGSFLAPFLYGLLLEKPPQRGLPGTLSSLDYDSKSDLHLHRMVCFPHPAAILDQLRRLRHVAGQIVPVVSLFTKSLISHGG